MPTCSWPGLPTRLLRAQAGSTRVKYDGYRIVAYVEGGAARLMTRNGKDYTDRFPRIAASLVQLAAGRAFVLDGEVVVADEDGRTDFQALQSHLRDPQGKQAAYLVFDLLAKDGDDWRGRPLTERKEALAHLLENAPDNLRFSKHIEGSGEDGFRAACRLGLEGIVGKKAGSPYRGTRSGDWVKLKCDRRQEFVIGGYTRSRKNATGISSLLLGSYEDGRLVYAGRAGSGLGQDEVGELQEAFVGLKRAKPPFADPPKPRAGERVRVARPPAGGGSAVRPVDPGRPAAPAQLQGPARRQGSSGRASGRRARPRARSAGSRAWAHVAARRSARTRPQGRKCTHGAEDDGRSPGGGRRDRDEPRQALVPRPARQEGAGGAVRRRPVAAPVCMCASGCRRPTPAQHRALPERSGHGLLLQEASRTRTLGRRRRVRPRRRRRRPGGVRFYLEDVAGLVSEAQMDTLEFHLWGSHVDTLEQPDLMVFDLDPDEGMDLGRVRQGVRDVKSVLDELSLTSYLKTSGGKGYHVVVPFLPSATWDVFHDFARRVAEVMVERWPDRYTSNIRKARRKGKIFVDWMRNGRGATSIAPYSLRARPGAPVSAPLPGKSSTWWRPDAVHLQEALERAGADPWEGFFDHAHALK